MAAPSRSSGTKKKREEVRGQPVPGEIAAVVRTHLEDCVVRDLRDALEQRREVFTFALACRLEEVLGAEEAVHGPAKEGEGTEEWIAIESLSALRAVVGGRFQQLKQRWTDAGLPLREHRGDRSGSATLKEHGWAELTNWILRQGYEVRRAPEESAHLFELRAIPKR